MAQSTAGFETTNLGTQGYYNGSDNAGGFESNGLLFKNTYTASFNSWDGFSISAKTDTTTAGYDNQYSSYAGAASEGNNFGV